MGKVNLLLLILGSFVIWNFQSCNQNSIQDNGSYLIVEELEDTLQVLSAVEPDTPWIYSTDGKFKLTIFPQAVTPDGAFSSLVPEKRIYYSVKLVKIENKDKLPYHHRKTFRLADQISRAQIDPVYYLTCFFYNEDHIVYSSLVSIDFWWGNTPSYFLFATNSFEKLIDSINIGIAYYVSDFGIRGWHPDGMKWSKEEKKIVKRGPPRILFEVPDLHSIIMPMDTNYLTGNYKVADEKWLKTKGAEIFTVHKRTDPPFRPRIPPIE